MSTDKNAVDDLEPGAVHADAVRGGADDAPAADKKEEKKSGRR